MHDPMIFTDGTEYFDKLSKKYEKHDNGLFILAPSGAGKTHYCKNQTNNHWIDGDDLWIGAGAHPNSAWWTEGIDTINHVDKLSDAITLIAKDQGFWIMGASNFWLKPDAIVIPDWETHKNFIETRHKENYDGGATPDDHAQVKSHIDAIQAWHTNENVPKFESIESAVSFLVQ